LRAYIDELARGDFCTPGVGVGRRSRPCCCSPAAAHAIDDHDGRWRCGRTERLAHAVTGLPVRSSPIRTSRRG